MGNLSKLALCLAAAWSALAAPAPLEAHPQMGNVIITEDTTVNSTHVQHSTASEASNPLSVIVKNSYGSAAQLYAYVTGTDTNGNVILLSTSGSWYYPSSTTSSVPVEIPSSADIAIPLSGDGTNKTLSLPGYCVSCRFWVADGQLTFYTVASGTGATSLVEPSAVNAADASANVKWGFMEFNYEDDDIYANLSWVDFVGLVMGMALKTTDGNWQIVEGLKAGSIAAVCNDLVAQADSDGWPWNDLCMYNSSGVAVRALSPNLYISANSDAFSGYYDSYIDSVWSYYETNTLTINTQASAGDVACTVSSSAGTLSCAGDNRAYAKPTAADIFGCNSGPFAIESTDNDVHVAVVPRLCAAFDRSTLLLSGGNVQPSLSASYYYTVSPTNHYSRIVHDFELDGLGYAFSYDDVNPSGANAAGVVSGTPSLLYIDVGGWNQN